LKAAVIGSPVSHSLSPAIFEFISYDQGIVVDYSAIEVNPLDHKKFLKEIKDSQEFVGLNVTLPLKELVAEAVDEISSAAKVMGAVNVIHFEKNLVHGHNTDAIGIEKTFKRAGLEVNSKVCLLWGAGGSAKAVAFVLGKLKAKSVYIYNRSSRGKDVAHIFSSHYPETSFQSISTLDEVKAETFSLMINATPLGMLGQDQGEAYFKQSEALKFSRDGLAFDLIYIPESTDFLKAAEKKGLKTIGGLGMLIDQALATWEIWFGPLKNEQLLYLRLTSFLKGILKLRYNPSPVYLTGFMGVGKSTIGKCLSRLTKREFVDTDKVIESISKLTIPEIFASVGESEFRRVENDAIKDVSAKVNSIISLGGGSLNHPENFQTIHNTGVVIYLEADLKTLDKRISEQGLHRPLLEGLQGEKRLAKIAQLLEERKSIYDKAAIMVNTSSLTINQTCFDIISKIGELQ